MLVKKSRYSEIYTKNFGEEGRTWVAKEGECKERKVSLITRPDDLKLIVEKEKGKHVLELEKALESIGVDIGQYHGGAFTGNMVDKVLPGYPFLLEPIQKGRSLAPKFC